jgi:hypothetical protein
MAGKSERLSSPLQDQVTIFPIISRPLQIFTDTEFALPMFRLQKLVALASASRTRPIRSELFGEYWAALSLAESLCCLET